MNRQWVSVLSVLALVVLAAPSSGVSVPAAPNDTEPSRTANNSTLGTSISSFMQVSSVEAESEVDREMFSAALANAPNESARQRLLERRADRLSARLDAIRQRVESSGGEGAGKTVERTVTAARVDALERSVAAVGELSNSAGGSPPGFAQLRENVRGLREPTVPPAIDIGDEGDPPGNSDPTDPNAGDGDEAPGQSGQAGGDGDGGTTGPGDGPNAGTGQNANGQDAGNGQNAGGGASGSEDGENAGQDGDDGPTIGSTANVTATAGASQVSGNGNVTGAGDGDGADNGTGSSAGDAPTTGNERSSDGNSGTGRDQGSGDPSNGSGNRGGGSPNGDGESASLSPVASS